MPEFILTSAKILADGRTVRLQFEAGVAVGQPALDRLKDVGFMDYLPAAKSGKVVTVNGQAAKVIGLQFEDWNMPLPWIDPPQSGGQIKAGEYFFLVAIHDKDGREIAVGPPIFGNSDNSGERGHMLSEGSKITLNWRMPPNGASTRIYASTLKPLVGNLRLACVANSPASSITLDMLPELSTTPWQRQSVCLTVTCLLDKPVPYSAVQGDQYAAVSVPDGLISDANGNTTPACRLQAWKWSCVDADGHLAVQRGKRVFISSTQGDDANDGTSKPFKTIGKALTSGAKWYSFRRGDTFPFEPWLVQTPGNLLYDAVCYDTYGEGPKPVLLGDTSTAPDPNGERVWFRQYNPKTGRVGDAPFQYFEGLKFVGDPTRGALSPVWPAGSPQDHIVLIDCEFSNIFLQPSYGSAQKRAPIGNALIRCTVSDVHANVASPAHVQGLFIAHCGDFLISDCHFSHNGWRYDGTTPTPGANNIFCHNIYCASMARQVIVHDTVIDMGGHSGLQMRGGGICYDCDFAYNVSGFCAMDTHSVMGCRFDGNGLYNHIVSQSPSWAPQAIHDGNTVRNMNGFNATRTWNANYDGLNCFHHDSQGQYVPHIIVVRHETSKDGGAISLGNMLPTHHLIVSHCLLENTGKDYKGNSLRNVVLKPGGKTVPVVEWDQNCYTYTECRDAFMWGALSTPQFTVWKSQSLMDQHSIELPAPTTPPPIADDGGYYGATDYRTPTPTPEPVPPGPAPQPVVPPIASEPLVQYLKAQIKAAEDYLAALGDQ